MGSVTLGDSMRRRRRMRSRPSGPTFKWRPWVLWGLAVVVAAFGLGYAVSVFILFPAPEEAATGVAVPSLVGRSTDEARSVLAELALEVRRTDPIPHPSLPAGEVVAQSPLPGQQLRAGDSVDLAISAGAPQLTVPDVTGMSMARAQDLLEDIGFEVLRQREEAYVPEGQVVRVDPAPGSVLSRADRVRIVVSEGPPTPTVPELPEDLDRPEAPAAAPGAGPVLP